MIRIIRADGTAEREQLQAMRGRCAAKNADIERAVRDRPRSGQHIMHLAAGKAAGAQALLPCREQVFRCDCADCRAQTRPHGCERLARNLLSSDRVDERFEQVGEYLAVDVADAVDRRAQHRVA